MAHTLSPSFSGGRGYRTKMKNWSENFSRAHKKNGSQISANKPLKTTRNL